MATAAATPAASAARQYGWLRSASFDMLFIFGVAILALAAGTAAVVRPEWFPILLFLDLWLLGYHHVISTFTRLSFDSESLAENRWMVFVLPWIVLAVTVVVGLTLGLWALATIYLYWQWFHYTRQSYGIARIYGRKAGETSLFDTRLTTWTLYLVPLWGHPVSFLPGDAPISRRRGGLFSHPVLAGGGFGRASAGCHPVLARAAIHRRCARAALRTR